MLRGVDPLKAWDPSGTLDRQDWDQLVPLLRQAGAEPESSMARLKRFSAMLISWNRSFSNLISKNDEGRFVTRHLVESLAPAGWLKLSGAKRWLDFGSGGGLPAIPLLFAGVGEKWTLVESRRTKTLFLRRVTQEMELAGLEVVNERLETMIAAGGEALRFDAFTSRATLPLVPTLALASSLVGSGGLAYLWKGSSHGEEMQTDQAWRRQWMHEDQLELVRGQVVVLRFRRL